jgi:hypothetical protein
MSLDNSHTHKTTEEDMIRGYLMNEKKYYSDIFIGTYN